jgi:hypothetical protein
LNNIIFIISKPIDSRQFQTLGFETFDKKKWNIKIISFNLKKNFRSKIKVNHKKINRLKDFRSLFTDYKNSYFINISEVSFISILINTILIFKKNIYVRLYINQIPTINISYINKIYNIKKFLTKNIYNLRLLFNKIKFTLAKKLYQLSEKIFYLCGRSLILYSGKLPHGITKNSKNIMSVATNDYLRVLKSSDYFKNKNSKYILYIDQNFEHHPDFKNDNKLITKKIFYESLNNFFHLLEKFTKKKIIIAAHPKCTINSKRFNNRKVFFNKTLELSKNAHLILAHYSTAVNYACIFKKPLLFLYSNEMLENKSSIVALIEEFANNFGSKMINIDTDNNKINLKDLLLINKEKYKKYFKYYISSTLKKQETFIKFIELVDNSKFKFNI